MDKKNTAIQAYESGLTTERHNQLASEFNSVVEGMSDLIETSKSIAVKDSTDIESIKQARETRLKLKNIRVEVEKKRKELKEGSLREGRAIEGMANLVKFVIVPVEEKLQKMEDIAKREAELKLRELVEDRTGKLQAFEVDCQHFNLEDMSPEAFAALLASSEAGYIAKKKAEKEEIDRIEAERKQKEKEAADKEKKRKAEEERMAEENAKLKAEKETAEAEAKEKEAAIQAEREKAEKEKKEAEAREQKLRDEIKAKAEAEAKEKTRKEATAQAKIIADAKAEKEAQQAKLAAPDKDKLSLLSDEICAVTIPPVSSDIALDTVQEIRGMLNAVVKRLRVAVKDLEA